VESVLQTKVKYVEQIGWWLWLLLLITLPVTSSPVVARFSGGETPVSPLALIPLAGVVIVVIVPHLVKGGKLSRLALPLIAFSLFAFVSAAISVTLPLIPFKGQTHLGRLTRGLVTLGIGIAFYFSAMIIPDTQQRLKTSLRAIYFGLIAMLLWSSVQAWLVLDGSARVPLITTRIHHLFSVRDPLGTRVTGMAYEPSWLGDQLVVLYIPLLLSSVAQGISVFNIGKQRISIELFLLIWSFFILLLTQSRISFFSLLILGTVAFFYLGGRGIRRLARRTVRPPGKRLLWGGGILFLLGLWCVVIYTSLLTLSRVDDRMTYLLRAPTRLEEFEYFFPNEAGFELADQLAFAERIVYWTAGLRTFSHYPLLGVGTGNMGFFFEENLPAYGYQLTEIRDVLKLTEFGFPNPKNLWIRLLSEGGILGFSTYFTWYLLSGLGAILLWRKGSGIIRVIGLAGGFAAITFFIEGFSLDSYALPQIWIVFGFVAAAIQAEDTLVDRV
jgi:O-antigen ligase